MNLNIFASSVLAVTLFAFVPHQEKSYAVHYKGALKNMMHKGDISAKADVKDLEQTEHVYALGAVAGLKGEILILDSKPFISYSKDNQVQISNSFDYKASLLVYSSVKEWDAFPIPDKISTYEDLEAFVQKTAKKNGIDTNEPFPFKLSGQAATINWHVINWKDGDTEHSHEKHITSGPHGSLENVAIDVLGFYSNSHHAIFTHHTTNMHLHIKTKDNKIAGHLDGIELGNEMTLYLPSAGSE